MKIPTKKNLLYTFLIIGIIVLLGRLAGPSFAGLMSPSSGSSGLNTPAAFCKTASSTWTLCSATEVLGDATNPISNGNFTSLTAGVLKVSGSAISDFIPATNNAYDLGSSSKSWRDFYASGTTRLGGNVIPNTNNSLDLGAFGNAWRDIYASGTVRIGAVSAYAGTSTFSALTVDTTDFVVASGTGRVGIGTANPNKLLTLSGSGGDSASMNFIVASIAHGMTDELPTTDSYGYLRDANGADGGVLMTGASDDAGTPGYVFQGIIGVTDPTDSNPAVRFEGSKKNGTTRQALGALETAIQFRTYTTELINILGSGNVLPGSNNAQDLGGSTLAWKSIFASGTSYLGHTISGGNNAYDLGSATSSWRDFYASGTTRLGGSIIPTPNNTVDIGAFGTAVRDIYVSSSIRLGDGGIGGSSTWSANGNFLTNNRIRVGDGGDSAPGYGFGGSGVSGQTTGLAFGTFDGQPSLMVGTNGTGVFIANTIRVRPRDNNVIDLGNYDAAWGNIYASGTLFGNNTVFQNRVMASGSYAQFARAGTATTTVWAGSTVGRGQFCFGDADGADAACIYRGSDGTLQTYTTTTY